jgi:hypothetical protein
MGYTTATPGRPGRLFTGDKQSPSGKAWIMVRYQISTKAKKEIICQLSQALSQRGEVDFACVHGSFLNPVMDFGILTLEYGRTLPRYLKNKSWTMKGS